MQKRSNLEILKGFSDVAEKLKHKELTDEYTQKEMKVLEEKNKEHNELMDSITPSPEFMKKEFTI